MFHFHKWLPVEREEDYTFKGSACVRYIQEYRRCSKCGDVQEFHYDSQGGSWGSLPDCEIEIVNRIIKRVGEGYRIETPEIPTPPPPRTT